MELCPTCNEALQGDPDVCPSCGTPIGSLWETPVEPSTRSASISVDEFFSDYDDPTPAPPPESAPPPQAIPQPIAAEPPPPAPQPIPQPTPQPTPQPIAAEPPPPAPQPIPAETNWDSGLPPITDVPAPPAPTAAVEQPPAPPEPELFDFDALFTDSGLPQGQHHGAEPEPELEHQWPEPDESTLRPKRTGHDGAGSAKAPKASTPIESPSTVDMAAAVARQATAASAQLDANFQIGPADNHQLVRGGLAVGAVALFLVGLLGTFAVAPDVAAVAEEAGSVQQAAIPGYDIDVGDANSAAQAGLVSVNIPDCDETLSLTGVLLDENTLVAAVNANPRSDTVNLSTGNSFASGVIAGWSPEERLAVITVDGELEGTPIEWLSANRARPGTELSVLAYDVVGQINWDATRIESVERNSLGVLAEFVLDRQDLTPGALLINSDGFLVGLVDPSGNGRAWSRDYLRPTVGHHLTAGDWRPAACPVAPPTTLPGESGSEPDAGTEPESGTDS